MNALDGNTFPAQTINRFWSKVDQSAGPDACWPFVHGSRDVDGYGSFSATHARAERAHRFAYAVAVGPIPAGLIVMHVCDCPPCCNPAHLRLGTVAENNADRAAKGRSARGDRHPTRTNPEKWAPERRARGEAHGRSKLSEVEIIAIREMYAAGAYQGMLARDFGVSQGCISLIVNGLKWTHVGGTVSTEAQNRPGRPVQRQGKLTEADVLAIVDAVRGGERTASVAQRFGVGQSAVQFIMRGRTWADVTGIVPNAAAAKYAGKAARVFYVTTPPHPGRADDGMASREEDCDAV